MNAESALIVVNAIGIGLTLWAERSAAADAASVRALNGHIVGIVVRGNLLRERFRLASQIVLLGIGLSFLTGPPSWPPRMLGVLIVSCLAVGSTLTEFRGRQKVGRYARAEIAAERDRRMDRLEDQGAQLSADIAENTRLTQEASDNATAAYSAANSLNVKIAGHGAALVSQGDAAAADRLVSADTNETAHRIDARVP